MKHHLGMSTLIVPVLLQMVIGVITVFNFILNGLLQIVIGVITKCGGTIKLGNAMAVARNLCRGEARKTSAGGVSR